MTRQCIAAAAAFLCFWLVTGCGSAPNEPTWAEDVRPIMAANCVRCHTVPAIQGAPDSFRLDVYEDTFTSDGRTILGAGTMAEFAAARAGAGQMPEEFPLRDRQRDVLNNWFALAAAGTAPPRGEGRVGNHRPTGAAQEQLVIPEDGSALVFDYVIRDRDGDIVQGSLQARGTQGQPTVVFDRDVRSGAGTTVWDWGVAIPGTYDIVASVDDGNGPVDLDFGSVAFTHRDDNAAPTLSFGSPNRYSIIADIDSPFDVVVDVVDIDPEDAGSLTLTLRAVRSGEEITIAEEVPVSPGSNTIEWNTLEVSEFDGWQLVATVSDGDESRDVTSAAVFVSHLESDVTFEEDVKGTLDRHCVLCHPSPGGSGPTRVPGLLHNFSEYETLDGALGAYDMRAEIYRRAVSLQNMPPESRQILLPQLADFSPAAREVLRQWALSGAARGPTDAGE